MDTLNNILQEIQDNLVPVLDTYEQAIYHYIFRHTYLAGESRCYFRTKSAQIGFGSGVKNTRPSEAQRSKKLRSLARKGAVKIIERSHKGILVEVVLPSQIPGLVGSEEESQVDLESLDFFTDKRLLPAILEREENRCFYTGRRISVDNCYLDHVIPQSAGGDNSYHNIVATCFDANSMKNDRSVDDFIRVLFREDLVSLAESKELKQKVESLMAGKLVPNYQSVLDALGT